MEQWRKRMVYRLKSSTTDEGKGVFSLFSCADDVEHKRHRRNPFQDKYLHAVLSSFESFGESYSHGSISRFEVEAASTNVHVRIELIKSMKENLAKTTSEAVKLYKGGIRRKDQKQSGKNVSENLESADIENSHQVEVEKDSFYQHDLYNLFCSRFGSYFQNYKSKNRKYGDLVLNSGGFSASYKESDLSLSLNEYSHFLELNVQENQNFLENENLCINLDKEVTESLESFLRSEFTGTLDSDIDIDGELNISTYRRYIKDVTKELVLDDCFSDVEDEDMNSIPEANQQTGDGVNSSQKGFPGQNDSYRMTEQSAFQDVFSDAEEHNTSETQKVDYSCGKGLRSDLEDDDSIEEFLDDMVRAGPVNTRKTVHNKSEALSATEIQPPDSSTEDLSDVEESFESNKVKDFGQSNEVKARDSLGISLTSEDLTKFYHAKLKQRRKKPHWLVQDIEKLLDSVDYFNNCNKLDCIQEISTHKMAVSSQTFTTSLSKPELNLVEHCKLLKESPLEIHGALNFEPLDGDEDCDFSEVTEACLQENFGTLATENAEDCQCADSVPDEGIKHHQEDAMEVSQDISWSSVDWEEFSRPSNLFSNEKIMGMEPLVETSRTTTAVFHGNSDVLNNSIRDKTDSDQYAQKTEVCHSSVITDLEPSLVEMPVETIDSYCKPSDSQTRCLSPLDTPVGSRREVSEPCFDKESLAEGDANVRTEKSPEITNNHETSMDLEMQKEDTTNEFSNMQADTRVKHNEGIEFKIPNSNIESMAVIPQQSLSHGIVNSGPHNEVKKKQNERKRQHINNLIEDLVMAECQSHQQVFQYFDLVPLSRSLASAISSMKATKGISNIEFEQLLKALNPNLSDSADAITMQRYYMALLTLAHQQNDGTFEGPLSNTHQIHLEVPSSFLLKDLVINLEPFQTSNK